MRFRVLLYMGLASLLAVSAQADRAPSVGQQLQAWLNAARADRAPLEEQAFADASLSKREASISHRLLWEDLVEAQRSKREKEMEEQKIVIGDFELRWKSKTFGSRPEGGRSLYISMHGGGGTRPEVNDEQWDNQIGIYEPEEGIYVAPRAPTNTWNLWHQKHVDDLFDRLIENHVMLAEVNPNKVFFMGYSAGGDGVYQLAPRMADRLAAAAMMAGHPNDAQPDGLRNIGFTLHMGGKDSAFNRNQVAREWKGKLADLEKKDPGGYQHEVVIHEEKGHWMEGKDAIAVPWMARFTRDPHPRKVVWLQDDVTHERFYWLSVAKDHAGKGQRVVATISGQVIQIDAAQGVGSLTILLSDDMVDLDQEIRVLWEKELLFQGKVPRTIGSVQRALAVRPDPSLAYVARLKVDLNQ